MTPVPFNKRAGIEIIELTKDKARIYMPFNQENTNHAGGIAAGGIFALGELAPGAVIIANLGSDYLLLAQKMETRSIKDADPDSVETELRDKRTKFETNP